MNTKASQFLQGPHTKPGKWSIGLIITMFVLFFAGTSFTSLLYASVPAGGTIMRDIAARPALALTMLAGMAPGILACITGLVSIVNQKERTLFVYISTAIGALLIIFLAGELLFPE